MNLWRTLTGTRNAPAQDISYRLAAARLQRVLENHKQFNELVDSGIEKLGGGYILDRQYLANLVDRAFSHAGEIVCDLNIAQTGSSHRKLYFKLSSLRSNLRRVLAWRPQVESGRLVLPLADIDELDHYHQVGGVFTRLAELRQRLGLLVPEGFVISVSAFNQFVKYNGLSHMMDLAGNRASGVSDELSVKIRNAAVPPELSEMIKREAAAVADSCGAPVRFVLNAAAFGQEYNQFSPGGYQTRADVAPEGLLDAYRSLLAAMFRPHAVAAREQIGLPARCHIAVSVSRMIPAQVDGIVNTIDPESPRWDQMRILLPTDSGSQILDVSRHPPYEVRSAASGESPLPAQDIARLAEKAMRIERYFRGPLEIKWAMDANGDIFIIHTRPPAPGGAGVAPPLNLSEAVSDREIIYEREGSVASPGISYGTVYHADGDGVENVPERGVLVAGDLEPGVELLQALKKAAAILMDHGAQAGHTAALAREFHVPAIVGLGDATTRLANGDTVTVDADDNIVYRGMVEELLNYHLWEYLDLDDAREYVLLRFVLHRLCSRNIAGSYQRREKLKSQETLEDIVRNSIETICDAVLESMRSAGFRPGGSAVRIENDPGLNFFVLDTGGPADTRTRRAAAKADSAAHDVLPSIPLACFLDGLSGAGFNPGPVDSGCAVVSGGFTLLVIGAGALSVIVTAHMSGEIEKNYIFGRVSDASREPVRNGTVQLWLREILDRYGFSSYTMPGSLTSWKYGVPSSAMEHNLRMLGMLMGYTHEGGEKDVASVRDEVDRFIELYATA